MLKIAYGAPICAAQMSNYTEKDYENQNDMKNGPLRNQRGSGILGGRKENWNDYERSDTVVGRHFCK